MGLDVLPSTNKTFEVYSMYDSAIDKDSSDAKAYATTGDVAHLRFYSTEEQPDGPVLFTCRPVAWDVYRPILIRAKGDMQSAAIELFRIGCVGFDNYWFVDDDGERKLLRYVPESRVGACDRMAEAVFRRIPQAYALDIGTAIFNASGLEEHVTAWISEHTRAPDEHRKNSSPVT